MLDKRSERTKKGGRDNPFFKKGYGNTELMGTVNQKSAGKTIMGKRGVIFVFERCDKPGRRV